jgi:hypothetical protein
MAKGYVIDKKGTILSEFETNPEKREREER